MRYTAVATYDASVTSKVATGYTATAEYKGELLNIAIEYEALYEKAGLFFIPHVFGAGFLLCALLVLILLVSLFAAIAYWGKNRYEHYLNRKRGYEA